MFFFGQSLGKVGKMPYLCSKLFCLYYTMRTFLKRIGLLLVYALLSLDSVYAESDIFRWGITAGGNISKVDGTGTGFMNTGWHYDSSGGYYAGITARLSLPILNFGLDASFVYSQEMADIESNGASIMDKLRYFSVPVHVRYDLELPFLSDLIIPYLFGGPQCNFALNDFDLYEFFRQDPESAKRLYEVDSEYRTSTRVWKLDLGVGVILVDHVQVSYFYAIPFESSFRFKTIYDDSKSHFKMGTHRIGLTYYF